VKTILNDPRMNRLRIE